MSSASPLRVNLLLGTAPVNGLTSTFPRSAWVSLERVPLG